MAPRAIVRRDRTVAPARPFAGSESCLVRVVNPVSPAGLSPAAARVLARIIQRAAASARQDDPTDD
jgi:hypothetical protein